MNGITAGCWNAYATLGAVPQAFALGQLTTGVFDCVINSRIDLILHRAVFCETTRHRKSPDREA
jgi:hypothetical protein